MRQVRRSRGHRTPDRGHGRLRRPPRKRGSRPRWPRWPTPSRRPPRGVGPFFALTATGGHAGRRDRPGPALHRPPGGLRGALAAAPGGHARPTTGCAPSTASTAPPATWSSTSPTRRPGGRGAVRAAPPAPRPAAARRRPGRPAALLRAWTWLQPWPRPPRVPTPPVDDEGPHVDLTAQSPSGSPRPGSVLGVARRRGRCPSCGTLGRPGVDGYGAYGLRGHLWLVLPPGAWTWASPTGCRRATCAPTATPSAWSTTGGVDDPDGPHGRRRRAGRAPSTTSRPSPTSRRGGGTATAWRPAAAERRFSTQDGGLRRRPPGSPPSTPTSSSGPARAGRPLGPGAAPAAPTPPDLPLGLGGYGALAGAVVNIRTTRGRETTRNDASYQHRPYPYDVRLAFVAPPLGGPGGGRSFGPPGEPGHPRRRRAASTG